MYVQFQIAKIFFDIFLWIYCGTMAMAAVMLFVFAVWVDKVKITSKEEKEKKR